MLAIAVSLGITLGVIVAALLFFRLLIWYANRSGVTGSKFFFHTWMDAIDGHPEAQARVIHGVLLAGAVIIAAIILR